MPKEISETEFESAVLKSKEIVLVDNYSSWCPPCRVIVPILEEIEREGKIKVFKLNVEQAPSIASRYSIFSVPTLLLFANGKECGRLVGLHPKEKIIAWIEEAKKRL